MNPKRGFGPPGRRSSRWHAGCLAVGVFSRSRSLALWLLAITLLMALPLAAEVLEPNDLSTPRRAMATFVDAANRADWARAILVLDVRPSASAEKKARASELAQELDYVLARSLSFRLDAISDEAQGKPDDGAESETVASVHVGGRSVPVVLARLKTQPARWVVSTGTLAAVPELYRAHGPSPLEPFVPPALRVETLGLARWQWLALPLAVMLAVVVAGVVVGLGARLALRLAGHTRVTWDDELVVALRSPGRLLTGVVAFAVLAHLLSLPAPVKLVCVRASGTLGLTALAWMVIRVVRLASDLVERRAIGATVNAPGAALRIGGIQTRVRVLRRIVNAVLAICAGAVILMQFDVVRSIGVSLLASAGVAGIVLGLAAQRTLGTLFAGIQLSITQPIRIGDEVQIENEVGSIEEITLTYVVVKLWDERRLIVPMSRFLEQPFQNYTKVSSELQGTVVLNADFTLPVDALRAELARLLQSHRLWDRRVQAVHVTDAKNRTLEVRVLVSAATGEALFNLRADLREHLAAWLVRLENGKYLAH
jgi:small-conductance mechanosensitive channel